MRVTFDDEALQRLAVDCEFTSESWKPEVIRAFRKRHQALLAAKDVADIGALTCLDLRPADDRAGSHASICLVDGTRLLLDFHADTIEEVAVVGIVEFDMRKAAT